MVTIFTPAYNRAHTLKRLWLSLCSQSSKDFEWLVIDDESVDSTEELFRNWLKENIINIRYYKVENGGKARAINKALELAQGEYFFIVDSDDFLENNAVEWIENKFNTIPQGVEGEKFIGISSIKKTFKGRPMSIMKFDEFVDISNLERDKYGLSVDMAEIFFTKKLRNYKFEVWPNEKFLPEAVVWNRIALDGYIIRWFKEGIYRCEYQSDGLTNSFWSLLKNNPMGYASLYKMNHKVSRSLRKKISSYVTYGSCCFLGRQVKYYLTNYKPVWAFILFPASYSLSLRRKIQIKKYAKT